MKYFSYNKTYEENKKEFRLLSKRYHPDKSTGNEEVMKAVNNEWELYEKTHNARPPDRSDMGQFVEAFWEALQMHIEYEEEPDEREYIMFMGREYLIDENILQTIALRYGGLGLMQFTSSKEWQEYINK